MFVLNNLKIQKYISYLIKIQFEITETKKFLPWPIHDYQT